MVYCTIPTYKIKVTVQWVCTSARANQSHLSTSMLQWLTIYISRMMKYVPPHVCKDKYSVTISVTRTIIYHFTCTHKVYLGIHNVHIFNTIACMHQGYSVIISIIPLHQYRKIMIILYRCTHLLEVITLYN